MHPMNMTATALPFASPAESETRLLLYCMRRMGAFGLHDAHAGNAMLSAFGLSYRRPLTMLRAFIAETARTAQRRICIAGCCSMRMTIDEARLLAAIVSSEVDMRNAAALLRATLASPDCLGALGAAQAVGAAFMDLGRPLGKR